jgi:hypothetical protein
MVWSCKEEVIQDKADAFAQYMKVRVAWAQGITNTKKEKHPPPPEFEAVKGQWKITTCSVKGRHTLF